MSSPLDITRVFQPVHWVVPPGSEVWVGDKNGAYIQALAALGQSMQKIAENRLDATAQQTAQTNYSSALAAAKQLTNGLNSVGVQDLDSAVQTLLLQPILYTKSFIVTDLDKAAAGQLNGKLKAFCTTANGTLRKYPFRSSADEVSLDDFRNLLVPQNGSVWKFQSQALAEVTMKDGNHWKANPTAKLQVTPDMLFFLNQAQAIADAFYAGGGTQPHFIYTLRPQVDSSLKDWKLTLTIDGLVKEWTPASRIQTDFAWPASAAKDRGAVGHIQGGAGTMTVPFASEGGLWGIFRIMGDAEPRPPLQPVVEWKNVRTGDGRLEPLVPPVRLEIVGFPGGVDVLNPKFFQSLRCPASAVQPPAQ
jgi:type VI protein secretion system component VasK